MRCVHNMCVDAGKLGAGTSPTWRKRPVALTVFIVCVESLSSKLIQIHNDMHNPVLQKGGYVYKSGESTLF